MLEQLVDVRVWLASYIAALVSTWLLVSLLRRQSTTISHSDTTSAPRKSDPKKSDPEKSDPEKSDSKKLYPRSTTFRLRGIPSLSFGHPISESDVIHLLKKAWKIEDGVNVTIHSLAMDPFAHHQKIATLSFQPLPTSISLSARTWIRTVPEAELTLDVEFFGLTPLHCGPDDNCAYDIVALSGLNGHAFGSFKQRGNENSFMWLRDALPQHLAQDELPSRVFTYGYDSQLVKSDSFQEISDLGRKFKDKMVQLTERSARQGIKPLILLGHSLGGIVVKEALISLNKRPTSVHDKRTLERLFGCIFFGTPSQGMNNKTLLSIVNGQPNDLLVRTLGYSTSLLRNQTDDFQYLFERSEFLTVWYYETKESPTAQQSEDGKWGMEGPKRRLVDISSATDGRPYDESRHKVRPVNKSHSEMVKFSGTADEDYTTVLADIKTIITSRSNGLQVVEFLKSLDFPRQYSRHDSIVHATENTCDWFFDSKEFRAWIKATSPADRKGLLWVKGNPGVGKSTLMKDALRRTQNSIPQASTNVVGFFFNARGGDLEKTTPGLYRSLIHQICKNDLKALGHLLAEYFEKMKGRVSGTVEWEQEILKGYFRQVCQKGISKPVIIFIDALDESTDPEISWMVEFFEGLVDRLRRTNAGLRVCISSRHCPSPRTLGYPELTVEHRNLVDIYTYIGEELKNYKTLLALRDKILKRSRGVFLWVRLVIRQLRREEDMYSGRTTTALEKMLDDIPSELGELFSGLLQKIDPADRLRSVLLFQLILFARERLYVDDIVAALSFHSETRFKTMEQWAESREYISGMGNQLDLIVNLSGGMLEFEFDKEEQPEFHFIHESARDYFLRYKGFDSLVVSHYGLSVGGWCHSAIAIACTNYLRMVSNQSIILDPTFLSVPAYSSYHLTGPIWKHDDFRQLWRAAMLRIPPFLLYATRHIYEHIELAENSGFSQEVTLRGLDQIHVHANSAFGKVSQDFDPEHTQFFRRCKRGMESFNTISRLVRVEPNARLMINQRDEKDDEYPLTIVCKDEKSGPLVKLLLENGAEVGVRVGGQRTALHTAAAHHNLEAVRFLLSYGADINSRDGMGRTAMHYAVRSRSIVELLLMEGANPDVIDNHGWTPLTMAGRKRAFGQLIPLINAGANVNHKISKGKPALHLALERSIIQEFPIDKEAWEVLYEAVRSFIANGLDLNVRDGEGHTTWHLWKIRRGNASQSTRVLWERIEWLLRPV